MKKFLVLYQSTVPASEQPRSDAATLSAISSWIAKMSSSMRSKR